MSAHHFSAIMNANHRFSAWSDVSDIAIISVEAVVMPKKVDHCNEHGSQMLWSQRRGTLCEPNVANDCAFIPQDERIILHNLACKMETLGVSHTRGLATSVKYSIGCPCVGKTVSIGTLPCI